MCLQSKFQPYRKHITGKPGTMTGKLEDLTKRSSDPSALMAREVAPATQPLLPASSSKTNASGASIVTKADKNFVNFSLAADSGIIRGSVLLKSPPTIELPPGIRPFTAEKDLRSDFFSMFGNGGKYEVRVEARKGGTTKIKTHYLQNYNMLESTFLIASIVILLCGIMFKAAELEPG